MRKHLREVLSGFCTVSEDYLIKSQISNSKVQIIFNTQISKVQTAIGIENWNLSINCYLIIGAWNFSANAEYHVKS